jgi:hypothetical protein
MGNPALGEQTAVWATGYLYMSLKDVVVVIVQAYPIALSAVFQVLIAMIFAV